MLELKTKHRLAQDAHTLALGLELVRHRNITYVPADFETRETDPAPDPDRKIWLPLTRTDIRHMAADQFNTLFANESELSSFDFMVMQNSIPNDDAPQVLLVKTEDKLMQLTQHGLLEIPSGEFVPNTIHPVLVEDKKAVERVFKVIVEWLDSEEEAHSLLHHLATSLAPGYSAVKYVLLLGEGRNGKSVLLKMLLALFGRENVSTVTRQQISEESPVVTELNGKLMNIVFDGRAEYLKDSGTEKSLIAGEIAPIRRLYESTPTMVQTNALFIEALQKEPKSSDKSSALQKRLVRFLFPNVYPLDITFEKKMLSQESLGAFLTLLIQHYVPAEDVATQLAPTRKTLELQLEHMYVNSLALQYLKFVSDTDPLGVSGVIGSQLPQLVKQFQSWRLKENDLGSWSEPDVVALFASLLNTERQSVRTSDGPRKVRMVTSYKLEALAYLATLEGDQHELTEAAVVAD